MLAALALFPRASASAARVSPEFFGIHPWSIPSDLELDRMRQGRVGTLRIPMFWLLVEKRRGRRDWSHYDDAVRRAAQVRMRVFPNFLGSPRWAARKAQFPPSATARGAYSRFVTEAVRRYGRGGSFWRRNRSLPYRPITTWQVWNEPNLHFYWNDRSSAREYGEFVKLNWRAIRRGDRRARVVLAGLPTTTVYGGARGVVMPRFLAGLYRVRGVRRYFDAVSLHPYARDVRGLERDVRVTREVMRRAGDSRTPLWITEVGWASAGKRSPFTRSPRGQAAMLSQAFGRLMSGRRRHRIGFIGWFSWRDPAEAPGQENHWTTKTGLFGTAGDQKPAWRAFTRFTGGDPGHGPLGGGSVPPPPPPPPPRDPGGGGGQPPPDPCVPIVPEVPCAPGL